MPICLSASCWFSLLYVFSTVQGRRRDTGAGSSRSSSAARALRTAGRLSPRRGCTGGAGGGPVSHCPSLLCYAAEFSSFRKFCADSAWHVSLMQSQLKFADRAEGPRPFPFSKWPSFVGSRIFQVSECTKACAAWHQTQTFPGCAVLPQ